MSAGSRPARLVLVRWRPFRLPLRHRFEAAHGALADRLGVLLELHDSEGRVGLGEASPMPSLGDGTVEDVLALLEAWAAAIVRAPDEVLAALASGTPTPTLPPSGGGGRTGTRTGRPPVMGAAAFDSGALTPTLPARGGRGSDPSERPTMGAAALACAIDTALLDLEGQRRGVPVARLLSDQPLRAVTVNAVVGSGGAAATVAFAGEAVAAGYGVLKLKVAAGALEADVERVAAVRRAHPDARIRLDANGAWNEAEATTALASLARFDIELVEQPVRASAVRALGRLRRRSLLSVAADEAVSEPGAVEALIEQRAADLLVLKPMRLGGPRRSLAIARRAAEAGVPSFVTTTFDSSIGTATALHLAAALGGGRPADGLSTVDHLSADLVTRPLRPRRGVLRAPVRPGLGVDLRASSVERLATGPWVEVRRR